MALRRIMGQKVARKQERATRKRPFLFTPWLYPGLWVHQENGNPLNVNHILGDSRPFSSTRSKNAEGVYNFQPGVARVSALPRVTSDEFIHPERVVEGMVLINPYWCPLIWQPLQGCAACSGCLPSIARCRKQPRAKG